MSAKYDEFLKDLEELCRKHRVQLSTEEYDAIEIWDLKKEEEAVYSNVIDRTTEDQRG